MDLQIAILDEPEATSIIRTFSKGLSIVAATANAVKEDEEKSVSHGMNSYITKLIGLKQLLIVPQ